MKTNLFNKWNEKKPSQPNALAVSNVLCGVCVRDWFNGEYMGIGDVFVRELVECVWAMRRIDGGSIENEIESTKIFCYCRLWMCVSMSIKSETELIVVRLPLLSTDTHSRSFARAFITFHVYFSFEYRVSFFVLTFFVYIVAVINYCYHNIIIAVVTRF